MTTNVNGKETSVTLNEATVYDASRRYAASAG